MSEIAFILTSSFHSKYLPLILAEHNIQYPVVGPSSGVSTDEDMLLRARKMVETGTKVFIATGRSPDLLIRTLSVPVTTLQYSVISVAKTVSSARKMSQKIACFLRYGRVYQTTLKYKSVFRDKLIITGYDNEADAPKSLEYLRANHIEVVICGGRGGTIIEKLGYPFRCVRLSFEDNDIMNCVSEAENLLNYTTQSTQCVNLMNIVHNNVDCGILATNQDGEITQVNDVALDFVGAKQHKLIHAKLSESIFSPLEHLIQSDQNNMLAAIGDKLFYASRRRIAVSDGQAAHVITLRSADQLLKSARNISQQLYVPTPAALGTQASKGYSKNKLYAKTLQMAAHFAQTDAPVLLEGPSGSGKSDIARSMHFDGPRADKPFVSVYCGAISADSADAILFGSTGPNGQTVYGKLELAHGGTIFLNEISMLPIESQAHLFRVIQSHELIDVYSNRTIHLDVKIIASSKYNLLQLVRENKFIEELYYSISVLQLYIPPLDERREDIPSLLTQFLSEKAVHGKYLVPEITPEAMTYLTQLSYHGNLRQLANIAERLLVLSGGQPVSLALAQMASDFVPPTLEHSSDAPSMQDELDASFIRKTLLDCGGKRALAAQRLGISTTTLWRKMKKYHLD